MKISDVEKDAKALFDSGNLASAKVHYDYLASKNHNPSNTNFMLGEISYSQKSYKDAISSYQASMQADDKSSHMPTLIYHMGVSFEKLGEAGNANKFYSYLKQTYPDSKEAKLLKN